MWSGGCGDPANPRDVVEAKFDDVTKPDGEAGLSRSFSEASKDWRVLPPPLPRARRTNDLSNDPYPSTEIRATDVWKYNMRFEIDS